MGVSRFSSLKGLPIRYWLPLSFKKFFRAVKYLGRTPTSNTVFVYVKRHEMALGDDIWLFLEWEKELGAPPHTIPTQRLPQTLQPLPKRLPVIALRQQLGTKYRAVRPAD
jgi:hypothetical protein